MPVSKASETLVASNPLLEKGAQDSTFTPQRGTVCVGGKRTGKIGNEAGDLIVFRSAGLATLGVPFGSTLSVNMRTATGLKKRAAPGKKMTKTYINNVRGLTKKDQTFSSATFHSFPP